MIVAPQTQKKLGITIAAPVRRRDIRMAFSILRTMAKQRGVRLTEGRRSRDPVTGARTVDFIVIKLRS